MTTTSQIMTTAWTIARDGAARFGGRPVQYIAQALRHAWSLARVPSYLPALTGTPKQVSWATDIRAKMWPDVEAACEKMISEQRELGETEENISILRSAQRRVLTTGTCTFATHWIDRRRDGGDGILSEYDLYRAIVEIQRNATA